MKYKEIILDGPIRLSLVPWRGSKKIGYIRLTNESGDYFGAIDKKSHCKKLIKALQEIIDGPTDKGGEGG